jgi:hypothetical protein
MKAKKCPASANWQEWLTLEALQELYPDLKLYSLRELLVRVPCYRCSDNTVRYPTEQAYAALNAPAATNAPPRRSRVVDLLDPDGEDDETLPSQSGYSLQQERDREYRLWLADVRRERNELIKLMETPLRIGVEMIHEASKVQAARLSRLEDQWDKLIRTTEEMVSLHADRDLAAKRQEQAVQLRGRAADAFLDQLPSLVKTWGLNRQATMAMELIASFDQDIFDGFISSGVLTAEQTSTLIQLRASLKKKPAPDQQAGDETNHHPPS